MGLKTIIILSILLLKYTSNAQIPKDSIVSISLTDSARASIFRSLNAIRFDTTQGGKAIWLGSGAWSVLTPTISVGRDTIKVIMLIADTSGYFNSGEVGWKMGYSVREIKCCTEGNTSSLAYSRQIPYYTHLYYLDNWNFPLKKEYVVWMSIPIK